WEKPWKSQIRNSNAFQLIAQAKKIHCETEYIGIAKDSEESTNYYITKAFKNNNVILLTGGVSMGDFDYVPAVLKKLGIEILFTSIAVQPGKPTVFGAAEDKFVFGLPGNPVSSFVQFELLVKPLIYKLSGYDFYPKKVSAQFDITYKRKRSSRLSVLPVQFVKEGRIAPVEYHGSAHINALTNASGFVFIPIGTHEIKKGEWKDVRLI
ncbi:MAG: hypothetical protein K8R53_09725, partial [Bacteroidales bacterium]|nr:hypothetical protein [Bacteroidales bacterium]